MSVVLEKQERYPECLVVNLSCPQQTNNSERGSSVTPARLPVRTVQQLRKNWLEEYKNGNGGW